MLLIPSCSSLDLRERELPVGCGVLHKEGEPLGTSRCRGLTGQPQSAEASLP